MTLSGRERAFVVVGVLVVLLVGFGDWVVRPLWQRRQTLQARVERSRNELKSFRELAARYQRDADGLKELERKLVRRGDGFSLFSFLEDSASKTGVRSRLVSMDPSESTGKDGYGRLEMSLRFEDLGLAQVVGYLQQLEKAPRLLRVGELSLERSGRSPNALKVSVQVVAFSTPEAKEGKP